VLRKVLPDATSKLLGHKELIEPKIRKRTATLHLQERLRQALL
jgi:hypothetical protein